MWCFNGWIEHSSGRDMGVVGKSISYAGNDVPRPITKNKTKLNKIKMKAN